MRREPSWRIPFGVLALLAALLAYGTLVSRLLGNADFQSSEHDSVEDARAALALYAKWRELKRQGKLEETLEALYDYGRAHGFDPSANSSSGGGVVFGQ